MDIIYRDPLDEKNECNFLEENMLSCLKEKYLKDNVEERSCKNEHLLWFFTECPSWLKKYEDKSSLRKIFISQKQLELDN